MMLRSGWSAVLIIALTGGPALAERIKRKPPNDQELARLASENVLNDGTLIPGDIVSTDRGFFLFRGLSPDGTGVFTAVQNPVKKGPPARP